MFGFGGSGESDDAGKRTAGGDENADANPWGQEASSSGEAGAQSAPSGSQDHGDLTAISAPPIMEVVEALHPPATEALDLTTPTPVSTPAAPMVSTSPLVPAILNNAIQSVTHGGQHIGEPKIVENIREAEGGAIATPPPATETPLPTPAPTSEAPPLVQPTPQPTIAPPPTLTPTPAPQSATSTPTPLPTISSSAPQPPPPLTTTPSSFLASFVRPSTPEIPYEEITPLTVAPEAMPGSDTSCMHFRVRTKLGWIAWREREASLYAVFERGFAATRCEMKWSESLEEFGFEVEVPNEQVEKFSKYFKSKNLTEEIDKIHGIDPISMNRRDAKLLDLKKTMGTTLKDTNVRSSISTLQTRFDSLALVGATRDKEVRAIADHFATLQKDMTKKFDDLSARIGNKIYENVGKKFGNIEREIMEVVREELSFLNVEIAGGNGGAVSGGIGGERKAEW
ncbi:hypothetical protein HDV00_007550 [Rhizophlyctis rosea]|nr:hypothetical protein HDV00_007550 [Rhizophlyctis rosea]